MNASAAPSEEDLLSTIQTLKRLHPDYGVHRIFSEIRKLKTDWVISEKRVKKIMQVWQKRIVNYPWDGARLYFSVDLLIYGQSAANQITMTAEIEV